jgi:xanthine phosphoribosyltransferase
MYYYTYEEFRDDTLILAQQCQPFQPDAILGIARGGLMLAQALAYALDVRNLQSIRVESYDDKHKREGLNLHVDCHLHTCKHVLIVDDIVDSGDTLKEVLYTLNKQYPDIIFKSASLFYKPTACIQSDFRVKEATEWIEFFWEKEFQTLSN